MNAKTFGAVIAEHRKSRQLSQKELASRVLKEDGQPMSPQYLNDLEHDRRDPPSEHFLKQFADILRMDLDYLHAVAGALPADVRERLKALDEEQAASALKAFRKKIGPSGGGKK